MFSILLQQHRLTRGLVLYFPIFFVICSVSFAQEDFSSKTLFDVLQEAYRTGEIDYETYLLNSLYAIFEPMHESLRWARERAGVIFFGKCGTPIIDEFVRNWHRLSPKVQAKFQELAPVNPTDYDSYYDYGRFRIFFDTTGFDAPNLADRNGIEDWRPFTDRNRNRRWDPGESLNDDVGMDGIAGTQDFGEGDGRPQYRTLTQPGEPNAAPDFVEKMARYFEESRIFITNSLGYEDVPLNTPEHLYYVGINDLGSYGFTLPLLEIDSNRYYSHIKVDNDFTFVKNNHEPEGKVPGAMKVTAAHEYFHAIQGGSYDLFLNPWWGEATSTWMEEQVYPQVDDYLHYLSDWFNRPSDSLDFDAGDIDGDGDDDDPHEYGTSVFVLYLSQSQDQNLIRAIWERGRDDNPTTGQVLQIIQSVLTDRGSDLRNAFGSFTSKNYQKEWYKDGKYYPDIKIENSANPFVVDEEGSIPEQTTNINHLASQYFKFIPGRKNSTKTTLRIDVRIQVDKNVGAWAIVKPKRGAKQEYEFTFDANGHGSVRIPSFYKRTVSEVALVLYNAEITESVGFNFSASIPANRPPIANAGPDQAVLVGSTVQLDGSGSSDPDGDSLKYSWQFIKKPSGSKARLSKSNIANPTF
ncbi:MAG: PKD domain-containing protein, partial [Nitrososphaerales archaeon]